MTMVNGSDALSTVKTSVPYALDEDAPRHRLGLVALATDEATERDFQRMIPAEAAYYTARILNVNPVTIENLRKLGPQLAEAAARILPGARIDAIAYSCTSGTVALGYDAVAAQINAGRPGVPVTTPITAGIAGLKRVGAKRITLFTPYIDSVNQAMRGFLEDHGIEVLNIASFCLDSDLDMARLPPDAIRAAAIEAHHPDADAVFISCTAIRAVEVIEEIEEALGKPVVSAIQSLFWETLRLSGYETPIAGFGRLMRL